MGTINSVLSFRQNVERMLYALRLLGDHEWVEDRRDRLRKLHQKLGALAMAPTAMLDRRLEVEFYAIIESHPKVRQASRWVFKQELVEICAEGLAYYAELVKKRPLTSGESEALRRVEEEHQRATEEACQLLRELLEEEAS